jgi:hypothetical protein
MMRCPTTYDTEGTCEDQFSTVRFRIDCVFEHAEHCGGRAQSPPASTLRDARVSFSTESTGEVVDAVRRRLAALRAKASELRDTMGDDGRARAIEWAAAEIELALNDDAEELLSLADAATISGYTADHLSRLVRTGKLVDRSAPHETRIRVRRGDVPIKARRAHISDADVRDLASRLFGG